MKWVFCQGQSLYQRKRSHFKFITMSFGKKTRSLSFMTCFILRLLLQMIKNTIKIYGTRDFNV